MRPDAFHFQPGYGPSPTGYDPNLACVPCRGRGWIILEDPLGAPSQKVVCPYCQGRQNAWWVQPRRLRKVTRMRVILTGVVLWLSYSIFPAHHFLLHMALLIPVVVILALAWLKGTPSWLKLPRRQHAPGFTDPREVKALGIFAAVVAARSLFGNRRQRGF